MKPSSRWCSQFTGGAGEDIRYLPRNTADGLRLAGYDYWMFDSSTVMRMHYDDSDAFVGSEPVDDPDEIVACNFSRDAAWHHAARRDDFAADQCLGVL